MKIGVLTFVPNKKELAIGTRSILSTLKTRGHKVTTLYAPSVGLVFGNGKTLTHKGKAIKSDDFDIILVRPGFTKDPSINSSIIKQFQLSGFPVINGYIGVFRAKNKIRTLQMLDHFNIPVPKTVVVENPELIVQAAEEFRFPVIVKSIYGTHGNGVFLAESKRSLAPIVEYLTAKEKGPVSVQEYIKEAKGKDLRVLVLGKKVVAAMSRHAKSGEFRANFHKGGSVNVADLSLEEKRMSIHAADVLGLDIAGVDILRTKNGPKIIEVNSNPGLEGISKATGIDLASVVADFVEKQGLKAMKSKKAPISPEKMKE